jgi:hypothetical protein
VLHNRNDQAGILAEHLDCGVEVADCVTPRREEHRDDVPGGHAEEEEDEILVVMAGHLKTEVKYSTAVTEPSSPVVDLTHAAKTNGRKARRCAAAG